MHEPALGERERRIMEAVSSLAWSLRHDRERLAKRLAALEHELAVLASKLDGQPTFVTLGGHPATRS